MKSLSNGYNKNDYKLLSFGYYGRFSDAELSAYKRNIPLLGGMYQDCSVIYNKDNDVLEISNSDQVYKCCLDNYDVIDRICFEKCNENFEKNSLDYNNCNDLCNNLRNKWVEGWEQSKEYKGNLDPFISEAIQLKCWDNKSNKPIKECVENNKEVLIKKCMENCIPTGYTDCSSDCNTSYKLITNPQEVSILFDNIINKNIKPNRDSTKYIYKYIILPIIIGIILSIIMIIIIKLKNINM